MQALLSLAGNDTAGGTRTFGKLDVRERVIDTGGRTIAVANISTISLARLDKGARRLVLWIMALVAGVAGLALLSQSDFASAVVPLALAALFVWLAVRLKDVITLAIGSNDGARTLFVGTNAAQLEEIKRFLTDKINTGDLRAGMFVVDQSKHETNIGSITTGPITTGSNNQIAANSPNARFGTSDTTYNVADSPYAQVGTGNVAVTTRVDYTSVLPSIEQWQRHAAESKGWEEVAERLAQLEALLKTGTPTRNEKSKVRSLAVDLSTMLQAYPAAVQLFQTVARLAGF